MSPLALACCWRRGRLIFATVHTLSALAQEVLAEDPFSGAVIVYSAKCSDRLKILVWESSGLVLVWKQLQQGSFRWPPIIDGVMKLSPVNDGLLGVRNPPGHQVQHCHRGAISRYRRRLSIAESGSKACSATRISKTVRR